MSSDIPTHEVTRVLDLYSEKDADETDRYYLCVTCGRLKHEDLYAHEGNCTCDDCHEADRHEINYREAPDGDGFVSKECYQTDGDCHEANS